MDNNKPVYRVDKKSLLNELSAYFNKVTIGIPMADFEESIYPDSKKVAEKILSNLEGSGAMVEERLIPKESVDKNILEELYLMGLDIQEQMKEIKSEIEEKVEEATYDFRDYARNIISNIDEIESYAYSAKDDAELIDTNIEIEKTDVEVKLNEFMSMVDTLRESLSLDKKEEEEE